MQKSEVIEMGLENMVHSFLDVIVVVGKTIHIPIMLSVFVLGILFRYLVYFTVQRHYLFSREFEKNTTDFLHNENIQKSSNISFYLIAKKILERTFYDTFSKRENSLKEKHDTLILADDRLFLTKYGCAWFVRELLKQIRFLQYSSTRPQFVSITRTVLGKNPAFNRVLGIISSSAVNEFLNILPGLFVIGGILGTFLGVMKGLPELSGMDLNDPEKTKLIMDHFLAEVSLSMGASVMGILLSVGMTLMNSVFSPDRVYADMIDRFENALDLLWNYATNNEVPSGTSLFNEHSIEALAEASVSQEYEKNRNR